MKLDKSFHKLGTVVKVLLLLIPGVSFVTEVLVRLSIFLRTKSVLALVMLLLGIFSGGIVLGILDILSILLTGKLFLAE